MFVTMIIFVGGLILIHTPLFVNNSLSTAGVVTHIQPFGTGYYDITFTYTVNDQRFQGTNRIIRTKKPIAVGSNIPVYYNLAHYAYGSINPPSIGPHSFGWFVFLCAISLFIYKLLSSKRVLSNIRSLPSKNRECGVTDLCLSSGHKVAGQLPFQPDFHKSVAFYYEKNLMSNLLWSHWEGSLSFKNSLDVAIRVVSSQYFYLGLEGDKNPIPLPYNLGQRYTSIFDANPLSGWQGDIDSVGWIKPNGRVYNPGIRVPFYLLLRGLRLYLTVVNTKGEENLFYFDFPSDNFTDSLSLGSQSNADNSVGEFYVGDNLATSEFFSRARLLDDDTTSYPTNLSGRDQCAKLDFNQPEIFGISFLSSSDKNTLPIYDPLNLKKTSSSFIPIHINIFNNSQTSLRIILADILSESQSCWLSSNFSGHPVNIKELLGDSQSPYHLDLINLGPKSEHSFILYWKTTAQNSPFPFSLACLACDSFGDLYYSQGHYLMNERF